MAPPAYVKQPGRGARMTPGNLVPNGNPARPGAYFYQM